jgi:hypothetical protein
MAGVDTAQSATDATNCAMLLRLEPILKVGLYKIAHSKPINKNTADARQVGQRAVYVMSDSQLRPKAYAVLLLLALI